MAELDPLEVGTDLDGGVNKIFRDILKPSGAGFRRSDSFGGSGLLDFFGTGGSRNSMGIDLIPPAGPPVDLPPPGQIGTGRKTPGGMEGLFKSIIESLSGEGGEGGSGGFGSASWESIFPEGILGGLMGLFQELLNNPGIPADVMSRAQGFSRAELLGQERRRIQRRSDEFSGRGLFGSGSHAGDIRGIEADTETEIGRSATALNLEDARLSAAGRQLAASLGLGLGNTGVEIGRLNLAELLGMGDLDLRRLALEIDKALREAELNLLIRNTFLGDGEDGGFNYGGILNENSGGGGDILSKLQELLTGIGGGDGGIIRPGAGVN